MISLKKSRFEVKFNAFFGSGSLGLLFGMTNTNTADIIPHINPDSKGFVVVRTFFFDDAINRGDTVGFLRKFLKVGLGVAPTTFGENLINFAENMFFDKSLGGAVALVEIDSAN